MAAPTGPAARISISDPQKQGEGMSAFISYKVHTEVRAAARGAVFAAAPEVVH